MSFDLREEIRSSLLKAGASAVGFAEAATVEDEAWSRFEHWLERNNAGSLAYMHNHKDLRRDPRLLLDGCRTLVSTAWLYNPPELRDPTLPYIARYAYGDDYHKSLRRILKPLCRQWEQNCPGLHTRICIDSAPVMERYWAVKSGIGFCGQNGTLIVPGTGSWVFLAEILLTEALAPDSPSTDSCLGCGACRRLCPAHALHPDGTLDCGLCHSALTVESPGGAPCSEDSPLAGCDRCQLICPHNQGAPVCRVPQMATLRQILTLDAERIAEMNPDEFKADFGKSALSRMGIEGLRINLSRCRSIH